MKMTESPVLSEVLNDSVYVGIPIPIIPQESTISGSSPSLLVLKSNNSTTVSPSKSFLSYVRYGGLVTFVSGAVLGAIGAVINLGFVVVSVLLDSLFGFGYFSSVLILCAEILFVFELWAFFIWWHHSTLIDSLVAVPSKNIGQLGLGFGFLGMPVLVGIIYELSAGYIARVVSLQAALLLCSQLLHYNNRTTEGANNSQSQHSGNVENTDSLVYAQIETV